MSVQLWNVKATMRKALSTHKSDASLFCKEPALKILVRWKESGAYRHYGPWELTSHTGGASWEGGVGETQQVPDLCNYRIVGKIPILTLFSYSFEPRQHLKT